MNYGAEPADQVVRYSLEGTEVALRLSGRAAVTFAKFVAAVLQDQKKDPRRKPGWSACCGKASR